MPVRSSSRGRAPSPARPGLGGRLTDLLSAVWRSPSGAVLLIAATIALCWGAAYVSGGAGVVPPLWFFLPVILAAWRFGIPGAALTAAVSTLFAGPLTYAEVAQQVPQATSDEVTRGAFFLGVGIVMSLVLGRMKANAADLERARGRAQGLLDSAGEGILGLDAEGATSFVNPAALRQTGYGEADLLLDGGLHALMHHSRADGTPCSADSCALLRPLRDGSRYDGEDLFWRKDGTSFPVWCTSMPNLRDGQIDGVVIVFRDISERREIDRRKDEFTSTVSHELRTPLTSIRGSLGLMAGGALGDLPPKAQRMVDIAVQNTDRLIRLINDILDIERIESGRVEMTPAAADAADLIDRAVSELRGSVEDGDEQLRVTAAPVTVWADADRIIQTLINLVANAIKFSPDRTPIEIAVSRDGEQAVFSVTDHGRGIPTDKLEAIFDRFEQVDSSDSREKGGTGLGLAICRSIITLHGGRIWAESEPGGGTTFRFTIPVARSIVDESGAAPVLTIGVCEPNAGARAALEQTLGALGHRVRAVASVAELAELLSSDRLDLALLAPPDSALGWSRAVGRLDQQRRVPLPIVWISPVGAERATALSGRPVGVLADPADRTALARAIESALVHRPSHVLLVEDDTHLVEVLSSQLGERGFAVHIARTGDEAIEQAQLHPPDMLILDVGLPDRDGFAVIETLQADARLSGKPLVVHTARELSLVDRARLTLGGPVTFLTKSRSEPDALLHTLEAARRDDDRALVPAA